VIPIVVFKKLKKYSSCDVCFHKVFLISSLHQSVLLSKHACSKN